MGGGPAHDLLLCLLPVPEPTAALASLREKFPKLHIKYIHLQARATAQEVEEVVPPELWQNVTLLCTLFALPPSVAAVPHLTLVHLLSAGANQIQKAPLYTDTAIPFTTNNGIHPPQIAEWAVMTRLVASHGYHSLHALQQQHRWGKSPGGGAIDDDFGIVHDAVAQRVGILGYGSIGRQVARLAQALGMQVLAYTASPKPDPASRRDAGFIVPGTGDPDGSIPSAWYAGLDRASLHAFLAQDLDWLVVAVPLTTATTHFLSGPEFDVLSHAGARPAYITNIARGAIIDQPALIDALRDGRLAGAALDVTDPEPLPPDHPLWDLPNAIVTPHISSTSVAYVDRTFMLLTENLTRRQDGRPLLNVVRRERGY